MKSRNVERSAPVQVTGRKSRTGGKLRSRITKVWAARLPDYTTNREDLITLTSLCGRDERARETMVAWVGSFDPCLSYTGRLWVSGDATMPSIEIRIPPGANLFSLASGIRKVTPAIAVKDRCTSLAIIPAEVSTTMNYRLEEVDTDSLWRVFSIPTMHGYTQMLVEGDLMACLGYIEQHLPSH